MIKYDFQICHLMRSSVFPSGAAIHRGSRLRPVRPGRVSATTVGMGIAEAWLTVRYSCPGHDLVDHYTYALVSDGDLMEGVAAEAVSLAGHLRLGKLVYLYDQNHVSLAGATYLAA
jgi:transketolase